MSLVTYDLSDSDEEIVDDNDVKSTIESKQPGIIKQEKIDHLNEVEMQLEDVSISTDKTLEANLNGVNEDDVFTQETSDTMFSILPKPKDVIKESVVEEDDIPPSKERNVIDSKPLKERTRVQIKVPSLSEFKDVEENKSSKKTIQASTKKSSLLTLLPPPKGQISSKSLVPQILNKKPVENKSQSIKKSTNTNINKNSQSTKSVPPNKKPALLGSNYYSESDEDDEEVKSNAKVNDKGKKIDFFSLTSSAPELQNIDLIKIQKETEEMTNKYLMKQENALKKDNIPESNQYLNADVNEPGPSSSNMSLYNLQKEDILMKNKVEVGPKLPVPEQDYNLDSEGNIAIDDKAIQYLCGKRGIKRKNEVLESANITDINGEDIKPDEREWLVKALTENPIHRPVSLGVGPGGQSKKKHQITYLAHQAKAMELELQNQWSQNRMTRQQTQSKYGF